MTKSKETKRFESLANSMTYYIQDMLDGFSYGHSFSFKETEKYFRKCLQEAKGGCLAYVPSCKGQPKKKSK